MGKRRWDKSTVAGLKAALPREKVLAVAGLADGHAVALTGHLALGGAGAWELVAWHDIVQGGWDPAAGRLTWRDADGERRHLDLVEPGELPAVFRERVDATFVAEERIGPDRGAVVVTAQRRLDEPGEGLVFRVTVADPAQVPEAVTLAAAEERLEDFRRDLG
jgi:hypothetical protein